MVTTRTRQYWERLPLSRHSIAMGQDSSASSVAELQHAFVVLQRLSDPRLLLGGQALHGLVEAISLPLLPWMQQFRSILRRIVLEQP